MKVQIVIIDSDAQEQDLIGHGLDFDMPVAPQVGDCLSISRPNQAGSTNLIVRRAHWSLEYPDTAPIPYSGEQIVGVTKSVLVECEFTVGPYASEEHH